MTALHPTYNERTNGDVRRLAIDLRQRIERLDVLEDATFAELDRLTAVLPDNPAAAERLHGLPSRYPCACIAGAIIDPPMDHPDRDVMHWIRRCDVCRMSASDDAAAIHLAKVLGYGVAWAAHPARDDDFAPYATMTPAEARLKRGERIWTWGADEHTRSEPDIASEILRFLNEDFLHERKLDTITTPEGSRTPVRVVAIEMNGAIWRTDFDTDAPSPGEWTTALPNGACGSMYVGPRPTGDDGNEPTVGSIVNINGQAGLVMAALGRASDPDAFVGHVVPLDFRAAVELRLTRDLMTPADARAIAHVLDLEE